jgi:hypothetical protein
VNIDPQAVNKFDRDSRLNTHLLEPLLDLFLPDLALLDLVSWSPDLAVAVVLTVTQIDRDKPAKAAMSLTNILPTTRKSKFFRIIGSTAAFVRPKGRAQGVAAFDADAWPSFQLNSMP